MSRFSTIVIFGATCLLVAGAANGQSTPPSPPYYFLGAAYNNTTLGGITLPVYEDGAPIPTGILGCDGFNPDTNEFTGPSAVNLTFGTGFTWQVPLYIFNGSTLNVKGGNSGDGPGAVITGNLVEVHDNSTVNVSEQGFIPFNLNGYDHSTINISGGQVGESTVPPKGGIVVSDNASATITGGLVYGGVSAIGGAGSPTITITGNAHVDGAGASFSGASITVSGGQVGGVLVTDLATAQITGGQVGSVTSQTNGLADVSGGTVTGSVFTDEGIVTVEGGAVVEGSLSAVDPGGIATMNGGQVAGDATAAQTASLVIAGGSIGGNVSASNGSTTSIASAMVMGDASETSGTLYINDGAVIAGNALAQGGQLTMNGGTVSGSLYAQGNSLVTVTGGTISTGIIINDSSVVTMSGGTVQGNCTMTTGTFTMTGGTIGGLGSQGTAVATLAGGTVTGAIAASQSSQINLAGVIATGGLTTHNSSVVTLSSGSLSGSVNAYDSSTIYWTGGFLSTGNIGGILGFDISSVSVHDAARFIWQGGTVTSSNAIGIPAAGSTARPLTSAGSSPIPIYVYDNGTFEVDGINLSASLIDPNNNGMYSEYQVSGLFGNGTPIPGGLQLFVQNTTGGVTPPTLSLIGTAQKWQPDANGTWGSTGNWAPAILPDAPGDFADFSGVGAPATITLDGDRTVGQLSIGNSTNTVTIAQGTGGSLILNNNGADVAINVAGNEQITAPVIGQDNTDVVATDDNSFLTFAGGITMAAGKTLTLTWNFSGAPGRLSIPTGSVIDGNVAANYGTIDIEGGTVNGNVSPMTSSFVTLGGGTVNGSVSASGLSRVTLSGGNLQGNLQLNNSARATINSGSVTGGVSVQDTTILTLGGGTIGNLLGQVSGSITMTGGTVGGSVELDDNSSMTMSGGTISLGLSAVTVNDSAKLTWSGGTISGSTSGNQAPIYLNDSSSLTVNGLGVDTLLLVDPNSDGGMYSEYELSGYLSNGAPIPSGVELFVENPTGGAAAPTVTLATPTTTWAMAGGGSWGSRSNWSPTVIPGGAGMTADLSAATFTITLDGDRTIGSLLMQGNSSFNITQGTGGSLIFNDYGLDAAIKVSGGYQIQAPVVSQENMDITIAAYSSLTLSDGIASAGGKNVTLTSSSAGSLTILGSATIGGDLVANAGSLDMEGGTVNGKLSAGGSSIVTLGSGNIAGELLLQGSANITMNGGNAGGVESHGTSELDMYGGEIDGDINSYDTSFVYLAGAVFGNINLYNSSDVAIGGEYPPSTASPGLKANPLGGNAHPLTTPSTTNSIYVHDSAELDFDGINLSATLVDGSNSNGMYSEYQLNGYYSDGTPIPSGVNFFVQNNTGAVFDLIGSGQQWNASGSGSWGTAANWLPAIPADGPGQYAQFNSGAAPATINLDGNRTLGQLTMTGGESFTIVPGSGGSLTLNNSGNDAFIQTTGRQQIAVPIIAQGNTDIFVSYDPSLGQSDNGVLTLSDGITVSAGKILTSADVGTLSVAFIRGGTLDVDQGTVSVIPNGTSAGASRLEGLVINTASGAILDLANNDLLVNNSTLADIVPLIQSGFANGKWNGAGIISSSATMAKGLGVLTGAQFLAMHPGDQFDGNTVAATDVLVKYTLYGDTNFDGVVNASDYEAIDNGFNMGLGDWADGDFNYDGVVNGDDYTLIDNAFNSQGSVDPGAEGVPAEMIALDTEQLAVVPEPASVGMIFVGAAALLRRRRFI
jgi:fibronectin-binding autotransporter adhesin